MSISLAAMDGSRPASRDGVSFMSRYPALQSPGTEAATTSLGGSYDDETKAGAARMSLSQISSANTQAADEVQFHEMIVPPNAGTGTATLQDESMIFARHNSELALQDSTRAKTSSRKFVEDFGHSPRDSNSNQWFAQRPPRSKAPNTVMMRFASRKKQLNSLNKRTKQVMTGAPVSRHIPSGAFDPSEERAMTTAGHANDMHIPKPAGLQGSADDAHKVPGPFSSGRKLPSRMDSRPRLTIPRGGHPGAGTRGTDGAGSPHVGKKGARLDEVSPQRKHVAWSEFDGTASSMASFSSTGTSSTTASFRSSRSRQSSRAGGSPEPLYTVQGAPVYTVGCNGGIGMGMGIGSPVGRSLSMPAMMARTPSPARSRRSLASPGSPGMPMATQQMNEFRRTSAEFSTAAPHLSLYDDDGYVAENPPPEGPLDWNELGDFYESQSSASVSSPTRMRVGLTTAMMRVDTPCSPQRPISRSMTAAKQADRYGSKAGNRCATPDDLRRSSNFVASPIYVGATREAQLDMAKPWRALVKVAPERTSPQNLDGRSGTGISSSGVMTGISVATLS